MYDKKERTVIKNPTFFIISLNILHLFLLYFALNIVIFLWRESLRVQNRFVMQPLQIHRYVAAQK